MALMYDPPRRDGRRDGSVPIVGEMVAGFSNVTVFEVYNEYHTASSPRNECMKYVTGKYLFFLDIDEKRKFFATFCM